MSTFGEFPGVAGLPSALAVFDDGSGSGPGLYVGGELTQAGTVAVSAIARWDGDWSYVGDGLNDPFTEIEDLLVFDDGGGSALYACGRSQQADALVARWDGTNWTEVGRSFGEFFALESFDDGGGPALYLGGVIGSIGGVAASGVAKWNGTSWLPLGGGLNDTVYALEAHDDGSGSALFVGGSFTNAGGTPANRIARWNGSSWSALGSGMDDADAWVEALRVFDDGSGGGPALYAGGSFPTAGGVAAANIARWNGTGWSALGAGLSASCTALGVFDAGGGAALYAAGVLAGIPSNGLARWDGSSWSAVPGMSALAHIHALAVYDVGSGPALYTGGYVFTATGAPYHIASWDGTSWATLGGGIADSFETVVPIRALGTFDDGSGDALYAAGSFGANGTGGTHIAKWSGSSWSALGGGTNGRVLAMAAFEDGSGRALYAGGFFTQVDGMAANSVARWDGSAWSVLGAGVDSQVNALCVFDDGSGPALVAGGVFSNAGGAPASRVARWNGASWSPLGTGMSGGTVLALLVVGDPGSQTLYAGGSFRTAGGNPASRIAKWDGAAWSSLGIGVDQDVEALAVFDDGLGDGPVLYAGGRFAGAVVRWEGTGWSAVGGGLSHRVHALRVFDDASGGGAALYAGGAFTSAGGSPANRIARWNGTSWSAVGQGMNGEVYALSTLGDRCGPGGDLYAGGGFTIALDSLDSYLARLQGCPDTEPPVIVCPVRVSAPDVLSGTPGRVVTFTVTAADCRDPAPVVVCVPPSGSFFPSGTTLVTCTATDASGNQSACEFEVVVTPKARR